ncbi:MAG: molybdenum cofactor biosynthesis protein MoaE [Thermoanaerobaculia bacterium]
MYLTAAALDVASMLNEARTGDGAVAVFVGVVRDENAGRRTAEIRYEAYGPMAESEMEKIAAGLTREWPRARVRMAHRVGRLQVGEASVYVVATAPHRAEAFAACRAAIDRIKSTVPIWKKERYADGTEEWVENAPDRMSGPELP